MKHSGGMNTESSFNRPTTNSRGGVLIGAVVVMVVMGVLGAGMVAMLGTSSLQEVRANYAERATYLAESGIRYALSEYRKPTGGGKTAILALNNTTTNVPAGGSFALTVSEIDTAAGGYFTDSFTVTHGYSKDIVEVGENLNVELAGVVNGPRPKLPEYYGVITVGGLDVRYRRYQVSSYEEATNTVTGTLHYVYAPVLLPEGDTVQATLVTADDKIMIESTGTFGSGLLGVSRSVTGEWFDWASAGGMGGGTGGEELGIGFDLPGQMKEEYAITPISSHMDTTQWKSEVFTADFVHPQGGTFRRTFLLVRGHDSTGSGTGEVRYHYVPFRHNSANVGLSQARDINNDRLSYDLQVKTATSPAFNYGAMGLMFRAQRQGTGQNRWYSGYGISFMRYQWPVTSLATRDFIPAGVKAQAAATGDQNDRFLMVLWEQTGQNTWNWVAYKRLHRLSNHSPGYYWNASATEVYDGFVRGTQYWGDGYFVHDDTTVMVRVVERIIDGNRTNDIQLFFGDARWSSNVQTGRTQDTDAYNVETGRYGYEQRFSPTAGEELWAWPSVPNISSAHWVAADNDWMTAVPWDGVNASRSTPAQLVADEAGQLSIVRDGAFTSAGFTNNQNTHPEVVIHTFGNTTTTQWTLRQGRVYFADFAIRLLRGEGSGLVPETPWAGPILY